MKGLFALLATTMVLNTGVAYAQSGTTVIQHETRTVAPQKEVRVEREIVPVAVPVPVAPEETSNSNSNNSSSSSYKKTTKKIVPAATQKTTTTRRVSTAPRPRPRVAQKTVTRTTKPAAQVIEQTEEHHTSNESNSNSSSSQ